MTSVTGGDHHHHHHHHHHQGNGDRDDHGKGDDRIWSLSEQVNHLIATRVPGHGSFADAPTVTAAIGSGAVTVHAGTNLGDGDVKFLSDSGLSTVLGGGATTLFGGSGKLLAGLEAKGDSSAPHGAVTLSGGYHGLLSIGDFVGSIAGGQHLEQYQPHGGSTSTITLSDNLKLILTGFEHS